MSPAGNFPLVAVDVGNSRIKLGRFDASPSASESPIPIETREIPSGESHFSELERWCPPHAPASSWWIGSVNRPGCTELIDWLRDRVAAGQARLMAHRDLPLTVGLPRPDMVGIDRLLAAVAVNRLRTKDRAAVVIDIGTAITVDLVSAEGVFLGGAIMPGMRLSAHALHDYADLLPLLDPRDLRTVPPPLGEATVPAMQAGLFWGTVGALRELVAQYAKRLSTTPEVFLSGGDAQLVAAQLDSHVHCEPHLVLSGIAIAAAEAQSG